VETLTIPTGASVTSVLEKDWSLRVLPRSWANTRRIGTSPAPA
jgi:hypothetical protein